MVEFKKTGKGKGKGGVSLTIKGLSSFVVSRDSSDGEGTEKAVVDKSAVLDLANMVLLVGENEFPISPTRESGYCMNITGASNIGSWIGLNLNFRPKSKKKTNKKSLQDLF